MQRAAGASYLISTSEQSAFGIKGNVRVKIWRAGVRINSHSEVLGKIGIVNSSDTGLSQLQSAVNSINGSQLIYLTAGTDNVSTCGDSPVEARCSPNRKASSTIVIVGFLPPHVGKTELPPR